jgi:hypothetical protein
MSRVELEQKLNKSEITTSKQEMKIGISKKVRGQKN